MKLSDPPADRQLFPRIRCFATEKEAVNSIFLEAFVVLAAISSLTERKPTAKFEGG
jgi:hypothetical protein